MSAPASNALVAMWQQWRWHGTLPEPGGWAAQPLRIVTAFEMLELAYQTGKEEDWSKLSPLQRELKLWLESEDD